jgi:hypothetical protein
MGELKQERTILHQESERLPVTGYSIATAPFLLDPAYGSSLE